MTYLLDQFIAWISPLLEFLKYATLSFDLNATLGSALVIDMHESITISAREFQIRAFNIPYTNGNCKLKYLIIVEYYYFIELPIFMHEIEAYIII